MASHLPMFFRTSSGNTNGFERYEFPDTTARYVKITVNGNTLNDWASILEISVFGDPNNTPTAPPTRLQRHRLLIPRSISPLWVTGDAPLKPKVTLDNIVQKTPEIVLALGDLSYKDTPDCWLKLDKPNKRDNQIQHGKS